MVWRLQWVVTLMSGLETFRDRSFRFAVSIVRQYRVLSAGSVVPEHLARQMLRAGTSVGANLAEAQSASSRRDLIAKNAIALREARECAYWLRLIQSDQPTLASPLAPLLAECEALIAILATAINHLKPPPRQ